MIDGIRGPLVLFILMLHYNHLQFAANLTERAYLLVSTMGMMSMEVFFVVSGFLITGILLRSKGAPKYFSTFYGRRVLRILPLYYGFIAVWFFVVPRLEPEKALELVGSWRSQVFFWLHSTNVLFAIRDRAAASLAHFWSLSVEEQFYLIWPLVVLRCDARQLRNVCVGLIVAAPLVRVVTVNAGFPIAAYVLPLCRMDSLSLGALLALASTRPGGLEPFVRWARPAAVLALGAATYVFIGMDMSIRDPFYNTAGLSISALLAVSVVILALTHRLGRVGNFLLTHAPLTTIGRYCYGMYILHRPLIVLGDHYGYSFAAVHGVIPSRLAAQFVYTFSMTVITFCIAWSVWHVFEKHFLKLKVFLPYGRGSREGGDSRQAREVRKEATLSSSP